MKVLEYNDLNTKGLEEKYQKLKFAISNSDFYTAQVKTLKNHDILSARLDYTNRLLFKLAKYRDQKYALMLEVVRNHDYKGARFLNGAKIIEDKLLTADECYEHREVKFLNTKESKFYYLNKVISFDDDQSLIYKKSLPIVIIGSAGSGKTMLSLERMKNLYGYILYISQSPYLVDSAKNIYFSKKYRNDNQEIDFLSYIDFLETIQTFDNKSFTYTDFKSWYLKYKNVTKINDPEKLFEEIKGTLTGNSIRDPYLSKQEYLDLGVKQSLFLQHEKERAYKLFSTYVEHIKKNHLIDINLLSHEYLKLAKPKYDFVIIDEVQDLTSVQIELILRTLKNRDQFLFCGDSNQIVHPNFFSWAKIKTLLHQKEEMYSAEILFLLTTNYRSSKAVVDIANNVLKLKQQRFGSIDKESNYLVNSITENKGSISFLAIKNKEIKKLNASSKRSINYAVIVLQEEHKSLAQQYFDNPLIFSIHEAKGLEYENIILFNIVSSAYDKFDEIACNITKQDLEKDLTYSRAKDKKDKSLESYKFYINAFYVGITRSISNLYIIEERTNSAFLELLDVYSFTQSDIKNEQSSFEDWQKEAAKLKKQGKLEQADNIKSSILQEQEITWDVLSSDMIKKLYDKVINDEATKKEKILLFEYGLLNNRRDIISFLKDINLNAAKNEKKSFQIIKDKYYADYIRKDNANVINNTKKYGLDFKDRFGLTPLHIAVKIGNAELTKNLIERGANTQIADNNGLISIQNFLSYLFYFGQYTKLDYIIQLYDILSHDSLVIKTNKKLYKIDSNRMEYFLYHYMLGSLVNYIIKNNNSWFGGFTAVALHKYLSWIPEQILADYQKRRVYISSILSKHEKNSRNQYAKFLFLRLKTGHYIPNIEIQVKIQGDWVKLSDIIQLEPQEHHVEFHNQMRLQAMVRNCAKTNNSPHTEMKTLEVSNF